MRKVYYTGYAAHAIRLYVKSLEEDTTEFPTEAEARNWECAEKTFTKLSPRERDVMKIVYRQDGPVPMQDRVNTAAKETGFSPESVWTVCDRTMKMFATIRGLI